MKHIILRSLRLLFILTSLVFILLMLLWAGLQTTTGQTYFANFIETTLSSDDNIVTIEGIEGSFPEDITLQTVIVRNNQDKERLHITNAKLHWSLFAILKGRITIYQLSADSVIFTKLPSATTKPKQPSDITKLLPIMSRVSIHDIHIKQLAINNENQHFVYTLYGGIKPDAGNNLQTYLHMETLDGPKSHALFTIGITPENTHLSIHGYFNEAAGGNVSTLLGLEKENLFFKIDGDAPLDKWQGNFAFYLSDTPTLTGTVSLSSQKNEHLLSLKATLTPPARLLPAALQPEFSKDDLLQLELNTKIQGKSIIFPLAKISNTKHTLQFFGHSTDDGIKGRLAGRLSLPSPPNERLTFSADINKTATLLDFSAIKGSILQGVFSGNIQLNLKNKTTKSTIIYVNPNFLQPNNHITLTTTLSGNISDPLFSTHIAGNNIEYNNIALSSLEGILTAQHLFSTPKGDFTLTANHKKQDYHLHSQFAATANYIDLTQLTFTALKTDIFGKLRLYKATALLEGTLEGTSNLEAFAPFINQNATGNIRIKADFRPKHTKQNVALTLEGKNLQGGNTAPFTISQANASILLTDLLHEKKGEAALYIRGLSSPNLQAESLTLTAKGSHKKLDFFSEGIGKATRPFIFTTKGKIQTGETLKVTLQAFSGRYNRREFSLQKPTLLEHSTTKTTLQTTTLLYAEGTATIHGTVDTKRADIALELQNIPLSALPVTKARYLSGNANGSLRITGNPASPITTLSVVISQLVYNDNNQTTATIPPFTLETKALLQNGKFSADATIDVHNTKQAELHITLPAQFSLQPFAFNLPPQGTLQGSLTSEIDANSLTNILLLDNQKLGGTISSKLSLGGTLSTPKLNGTVRLQNGLYEHNVIGILLHDITIELDISSDRIKILRAMATDGGKGSMTASGNIDFSPLSPFLININLDQFYVVQSDNLAIRANGKTTLTSNMDVLTLRGKLTIDKADIHIPERIAPSITKLHVTEINIPEGQRRKTTRLPLIKRSADSNPIPIMLDLNIDLPNRVFLRGRGLDAELSGNVHITGNITAPDTVGTLTVIRGRYQFIGQSFTLSPTSTAIFKGTIPPSPFLNITAESLADDITAQVKFTGTLKAPKLDITSTPSLPKEEVLSRLLFGRDLKTITPTQTLRLVNVMRELIGQGSDINFLDRTRSFLKLDDLDIKQDEQGKSAVGVGKYLQEGVYVEAQKNLSSEGGKATVEIELTPHITVESEIGFAPPSTTTPSAETSAQGGVGINWKHDY